MQCTTPIHPYTWLHERYHVVDQRVLDSVWPYFEYFKREKNNLPDLRGPLAQSVRSTLIAAANSEVHSVIESQNNKKRGQYPKYTPEQKSMIGKRAPEHLYTMCIRGVV